METVTRCRQRISTLCSTNICWSSSVCSSRLHKKNIDKIALGWSTESQREYTNTGRFKVLTKKKINSEDLCL